MERFILPRDLYHGKGALEALKSLKSARRDDSRRRRFYETLWLS